METNFISQNISGISSSDESEEEQVEVAFEKDGSDVLEITKMDGNAVTIRIPSPVQPLPSSPPVAHHKFKNFQLLLAALEAVEKKKEKDDVQEEIE